MLTTIAMTNKWQVHIPEAIRQALGIDRAMQFTVTTDKEAIILRPQKNGFNKFYGAFKTNKKLDLANIREVIDYGEL
jgi:bifunctional DNA-binding transcriptional regulator/antitoxin component of YhaV-PrlF toxin-antitoxin module